MTGPIWKLLRGLLFVVATMATIVFGFFLAAWLVPAMLATTQAESRYPDYGDVLSFDPTREGGHLLPNLNLLVQGEFRGHPVRFITNSKGFRDIREFDYEVPTGFTRIMFLGDSFVDGMRTDQEQTIGYLLEKFLEQNMPRNAGVQVLISGHNNPGNAWYYFQEHGYKYNPTLVILGVTLGNDLAWYSKPQTANERDRPWHWLAPPVTQTDQTKMDLLLPVDAYLPPDGLDQWRDLEMRLRGYLAAKSFLFTQIVPPLLAPKSRRRQVYAAEPLTSLCLFYRPVMKEAAKMFDDFEEVLGGFNDLVTQHASRLFVVLFPTRMQVSPKDWKLLIRAYSLDRTKFDLNYPNRRILDFCGKSGIACMDLLPLLREAEQRGEGPLYRSRGDMHLNETGQALAAQEIAKHLVGQRM